MTKAFLIFVIFFIIIIVSSIISFASSTTLFYTFKIIRNASIFKNLLFLNTFISIALRFYIKFWKYFLSFRIRCHFTNFFNLKKNTYLYLMCYFLNFIFAYIYCKKELPKKTIFFKNLLKKHCFYSKFLIFNY